jgi:hypothetical protein
MATIINADTSDGLKLTSDTSGQLELQSAGSTKVTMDATGNVGIGTASPTTTLDVETTVRSKANAATNDATVGKVSFYNTNAAASANPERASIEAGRQNSAWGAYLKFATSDATSAASEAMRIDSDGRLLVNQTSTNGQGYIQVSNTAGSALNVERKGVGPAVIFYETGSDVGSIDITASSTSYTTSSDYRLKENNVNITDGITRVKQLTPYRFNFIADADTTVDGFFAHEVQSVVPEAISGTKDAMRTEEYEVTPAVLDDDGNVVTEAVMGTREVPDYQGIDQSKLVPLLTAALQEAIQRIEALEAK